MAAFVFNIGKGKVNEHAAQTADLRMILLTQADSKAVLEDLATVADVLNNANTTEAGFDNYSRKPLANLQVTPDNTGNSQFSIADDLTYTDAGGTTDQTLVGALIYLHVTNDADSVPLTFSDISYTTTGVTFYLRIPTTGFFDAA